MDKLIMLIKDSVYQKLNLLHRTLLLEQYGGKHFTNKEKINLIDDIMNEYFENKNNEKQLSGYSKQELINQVIKSTDAECITTEIDNDGLHIHLRQV